MTVGGTLRSPAVSQCEAFRACNEWLATSLVSPACILEGKFPTLLFLRLIFSKPTNPYRQGKRKIAAPLHVANSNLARQTSINSLFYPSSRLPFHDRSPYDGRSWKGQRKEKEDSQTIFHPVSIHPKSPKQQATLTSSGTTRRRSTTTSRRYILHVAHSENLTGATVIDHPTSPHLQTVNSTTLARFARHGGPDLHHLRGVRLCCPSQHR
jgi:hypothetical protein